MDGSASFSSCLLAFYHQQSFHSGLWSSVAKMGELDQETDKFNLRNWRKEINNGPTPLFTPFLLSPLTPYPTYPCGGEESRQGRVFTPSPNGRRRRIKKKRRKTIVHVKASARAAQNCATLSFGGGKFQMLQKKRRQKVSWICFSLKLTDCINH